MTTKNEALYDYLTTHAGLSALVGTRIYPLRLPEGAVYPCIRHQEITLTPTMAHDGDRRFDHTREQFDVYAETMLGAEAAAEQVRLALNGQGFTVGTVTVETATMANRLEDYSLTLKAYKIILDFYLLIKS